MGLGFARIAAKPPVASRRSATASWQALYPLTLDKEKLPLQDIRPGAVLTCFGGRYAVSKKAPRGIAGLPYALTYPFQGFLLAIEWSLISFFWFRGNQTTMCLFVVIFVLHSIVFVIQRHSYLKERNIHLSTARKAFPVLLLAIILFCLFRVISFIN